MKQLARSKGMTPLFWFVTALLLFLIVGVALSISQQRRHMLDQVKAHMDREFSLMEAVISDDLLMRNYSRIERYLTLFASQYPEIYAVRAVADNGFVLAEYTRERPTSRPLTRSYCIDRGDQTCLVLELTHDLEADYRKLSALTGKYLAASAVFAVVMAVFLWYVLRKKAFIPLESALERLNAANAELEERVSVRTSEWERANSDLREEKDFTAAVLDTVGALVIVLDREGRIIRFNRSCEHMSGYAFEEVEGKLFWEVFFAPEQVEPVTAAFQMLTSGRFPTNYENYWTAKDGTRRTIAWSNTCLTDRSGGVTHVIVTGIDITESRTAAEELKKSEAKRRLVVENISEVIYSMSLAEGRLHGEVDFLGGSVQQTTGYDPEDFLRTPSLWLDLIHPDDLDGVKKAMQRMVQDRIETTRVYRLRHRETGNYVWMEDRMVPRTDERGVVAGYFGVARDVTRRKQAEDALKGALERAEEERNKSDAIIAAIGDGISIQDRDFRILYQNANHSRLIGNHAGEHCYRAYHGRSEVCPDCPIAMTFSDGKVHTVEQTGSAPSGTVHVEITTSALRDSSGTIIAGIEVVRDITGRKKAEKDLQRAYETESVINALLSIPVDEMSVESVLHSALDIVLASSWYAARPQGAILMNEDDSDLVMKAHRGMDERVLKACARVAPGRCLCGRAARSGGILFAPVLDERHEVRFEGMQPHGHYCVPISSSGNVLGVLTLCVGEGHPRDAHEQDFLSAAANAMAVIIERKRMEEERERMIIDLRKLLDTVSASRLEWQRTFDSITDMISIHDDDCNIIKANRAFAERFGLEPREVLNRKCSDLLPPAIDCTRRDTAEHKGPVTEEVTDPSTGKVYLVSTFPFSSADTPRGVVHIIRDITAAKENEMRLILSERLAALGRMASGIAHEINNPLTSIAGCVDGMNRRIGRGEYDQELFKKYLGIIKEEVGRTKSITTSMLSIVRKKDYEKKRLDIHSVLKKSLEAIEYQGRLKNVQVKTALAGEMPEIYGSEGELKQVFLIIITNALDAMDDTGTLFMETAVHDGFAAVSIADSGPGIPPENAARIFSPFFTTKADRGGTGLGLSIANRIVEAHDGRIRVSSMPGSGTSMIIELPV